MAEASSSTSHTNPSNPVVFFDISIGGQVKQVFLLSPEKIQTTGPLYVSCHLFFECTGRGEDEDGAIRRFCAENSRECQVGWLEERRGVGEE